MPLEVRGQLCEVRLSFYLPWVWGLLFLYFYLGLRADSGHQAYEMSAFIACAIWKTKVWVSLR